jgi:hypothetical protein
MSGIMTISYNDKAFIKHKGLNECHNTVFQNRALEIS